RHPARARHARVHPAEQHDAVGRCDRRVRPHVVGGQKELEIRTRRRFRRVSLQDYALEAANELRGRYGGSRERTERNEPNEFSIYRRHHVSRGTRESDGSSAAGTYRWAASKAFARSSSV